MEKARKMEEEVLYLSVAGRGDVSKKYLVVRFQSNNALGGTKGGGILCKLAKRIVRMCEHLDKWFHSPPISHKITGCWRRRGRFCLFLVPPPQTQNVKHLVVLTL